MSIGEPPWTRDVQALLDHADQCIERALSWEHQSLEYRIERAAEGLEALIQAQTLFALAEDES